MLEASFVCVTLHGNKQDPSTMQDCMHIAGMPFVYRCLGECRMHTLLGLVNAQCTRCWAW